MARNHSRARRRNELRRAKNHAAKQTVQRHEQQRRQYVRHLTELQRLLRRPAITPRQYEAGDRLYSDWRAAGDEPRIVPRYDRSIGLGSSGSTEHQVAARLRFERALRHVGREHTTILVHVCLLGNAVSEWPSAPAGEALGLLREGLDVLADWYGERRREVRELEVA